MHPGKPLVPCHWLPASRVSDTEVKSGSRDRVLPLLAAGSQGCSGLNRGCRWFSGMTPFFTSCFVRDPHTVAGVDPDSWSGFGRQKVARLRHCQDLTMAFFVFSFEDPFQGAFQGEVRCGRCAVHRRGKWLHRTLTVDTVRGHCCWPPALRNMPV